MKDVWLLVAFLLVLAVGLFSVAARLGVGEGRADDCNTCKPIGPGISECTAMYCPSKDAIAEWEAYQEKAKQVGSGKPVITLGQTEYVFIADKEMLQQQMLEAERAGKVLNIAVYEYNDKAQVWDRAREPHCLATMENAMRAMEPYLPDLHDEQPFYMQVRMTEPHSFWHSQTRLTSTQTEEWNGIRETWQSVKRECWRHP